MSDETKNVDEIEVVDAAVVDETPNVEPAPEVEAVAEATEQEAIQDSPEEGGKVVDLNGDPAEVAPKEDPAPQVDYSQFGYRSTETLEVPSALFFKLMTLSQLISQKESEAYYEQRASFDETFSAENAPLVLATRLGMEAQAIGMELNQLHIANVESGKATSIAVLKAEVEAANAPKVTLEE